MCLGMFLLRFILYETLLAFLNWVANSLPILAKILTIISSNIFSYPLLLSSSGTPMIQMLYLMLSQRSLRLLSFLFILFFCSASFISTILSSSSLVCPSASVILLVVPTSVFLISIIVFIADCLFFSSSRSLLNISFIPQSMSTVYLSVPPFYFQDFGSSLLSLL